MALTEKERKRYVKITLLMFRCEYIGNELFQSPLTKKGRGWFSPKFWRKYNDIMCAISPRHKKVVIDLLTVVQQSRKHQMN